MTKRTSHLRRQSLETRPSISPERALLMTDFYEGNAGRFSVPVMRARAFLHLCEHKTIYIGEDELVVGERGPLPESDSDLSRIDLPQRGGPEDSELAALDPLSTWTTNACGSTRKVIPYWRGRSMRDRMFAELPAEWKDCL